MPIQFEETGGGEAVFTGTCVIEEAESLQAWLKEHPEGPVNLSACEHLHTAVLQTLLAFKPKLSHPPTDGFLAKYIQPHLNQDANAA